MHLVRRTALRALSVALACSAAVGHAQSYVAVDLGSLGHGGSFAYNLSNTGIVVGHSSPPDNSQQAFSYANGTMTNLAAANWTQSHASGVNDAGVVVGQAQLADSSMYAFRYENGTITNLGALGGTSGYGYAVDINQSGTITGFADTGTATHAVIWSNGTMTDLGDLGGGTSYARAINDHGVVAGFSYTTMAIGSPQHAFTYSQGVMTDLGTLGGKDSIAFGINNAGTVVGYSMAAGSNASRAFSYTNGVMTDLGTLGGGWSIAFGINNAGTIVGHALIGDNATYHAFVYVNGVMSDLNSLVSIPGVTLDRANAINDLGQIVAMSGGRAYLLSPIPEPADYGALLGGAGLAFAWYRRRRARAA